TLFADDATTTYRVTYPTDSTWVYDGVNVNSSDPCTGGATDVPAGAYAITATATGQCESDYLNVCVGTTTVTAAPTITPATLYNSTTAFSGTAPASALLRLFRNGKLLATTTANASGAYSFSSLALNTGDSVQVSAQGTGLCVSTRVTRVVTCFTNAPVINTDNQGNLIVGATAITGKSGAPAGTVIRVYDEANALVGSTPVTATGSWSLTHTVASGKSYYAQAQTGSCGVSTSSATAPARPATTECATITSAYNENSPSVSGTIAASFAGTVRLYLDDVQIGSTAVPVNAGTWSVSIPANTLYPGGVLTVSSQATNAAERTGCPSTSTVSCTTPAAPIVSASTVTIPRNSSASFTITNSANGMLYALVDGSGTNYATSRFGNGGSLVDPTYVFGSVGTYNLSLKAISLSGPGCESTAPVTVQVTSTLPVHFLSLTARRTAAGNRVEWKVEAEEDVRQYVVERAREGQRFTDIVALPFTEGSGEKVYAWTDAGAPAGGKVWYRVREEDIDGSVHYSPVAVVASEGGIEAYVAPNPARDAATFYLSSARAARAVLLVTDAQGRSVRRQDLSLQAGFNALPLDLRGLSSGTYTVQVQASGAPVQTARLLVQ
ncbi:MAG TPA: T9SS type A sorting domain-containing protein, partial [Chitinophagaceae bacterium]|nr:T9SS type A sorting domain-containing protein [Chitinophagaceae bacterium]